VSKVTRRAGFTVPGRTVEADLPEESARVVRSVRLSSCLEVTIFPTYGAVSCHNPGHGGGLKGMDGRPRTVDCQKLGVVGVNVTFTVLRLRSYEMGRLPMGPGIELNFQGC
jgi:hypothetical protein